jgi:hypothetical protein
MSLVMEPSFRTMEAGLASVQAPDGLASVRYLTLRLCREGL